MVWFLIENNSQKIYVFDSLKELRQFAKKNKLHIKKSHASNTYYTESYVILPTEFND